VSIKKLYGPFSSLKNLSIDVQCTNIFLHDDWVQCVKFDGRGLLGTGTQTCLKIWNVDTGLCIRNISSTETKIVKDVSTIHFEMEAENDTSCVVAFSSKSDPTHIKCWSINDSVNYDIDYDIDHTPQYLDYFVKVEDVNFIRIAFDKEYHNRLTEKNASSTFRVTEKMQLPNKDKCPKCKDILGDGIEKPLSRLIICGHIYHATCVRAKCCVCYKDCSEKMPYTPSNTSVSFIQITKYAPSINGDYGTIMNASGRNVYIKKINGVACSCLKESQNSTVFCLNDSKDGLIASGSMDTDIKIWDNNGKYIKTLSGHTGGVLCVRFNEDGLLASGSYDKTVRLWDVETGQCIKTLIGHEQIVISVDFDGNGMLASGSYDKTVRLWKISR
jgi:WD40 repeat protein